jgi:hypothetical protein
MNKIIKNIITVGALSATLLLSRQAQAIPLGPGDVVVPPAIAAGPAFGLLDTVASPWVITAGFTGTVTTRVYNDPVFNPFGLTFTYDITINSNPPDTEALARLGLIDWAGFLVETFQTGAGDPAKSADRTPGAADIIGFNFSPDSTFFGGETSTTLILASNATDYKPSMYGVQSGLTVNGETFAPLLAVPEGSLTLVLLGIGFLSLHRFRRLVPA